MVILEDVKKYKYLQILRSGKDGRYHLYPVKIVYCNKSYVYFKYAGNVELLDWIKLSDINYTDTEAIDKLLSLQYRIVYFLEPPESIMNIDELNKAIDERKVNGMFQRKYQLINSNIAVSYWAMKGLIEYAEENPTEFKKFQEEKDISDEEIEYYRTSVEQFNKIILKGNTPEMLKERT